MKRVDITFIVTEEQTKVKAVGSLGNVVELDITDTDMEHDFKFLLRKISVEVDSKIENWK